MYLCSSKKSGMHRKLIVLIISVLTIFQIKGQTLQEFQSILNQFNADSISRTVHDLAAFQNRFCNNTPQGNKAVADYLVQRLRGYGIENARVDSFRYSGYTWATGQIDRFFYNVQGSIIGNSNSLDRYIIGAHLDAISTDNWILTPTAPGADDNASGCAVFVEIARIFHDNNLQPAHTITFMGWDAEEIGLVGSYYDAAVRDSLGETSYITVLNNDMVANQPENLPYTLDLYQYDNSVELHELGTDILERFTTITPNFPDDNSTMRMYSDSWAYDQSGCKAIFAIEHYFTENYHTEQDLPEFLNYDFAKEVAKYNFALLFHYCIADVFTLGEHLPELSESIQLYPNPVQSHCYIHSSTDNAIQSITIFDLSGKTIFQSNENNQFETVYSLDLSFLSHGFFMVKIDTNQGTVYKKIIKQ